MFIPHIYLVLAGKYHIGKSYWLSCCGVWYSSGLEILPVLVKVLGEFVFEKNIINHSITYSLVVINSYQSHIRICRIQTFHMLLALCWVLSSLVDPCWEIYHAPKIKSTYTPHICVASTLEVRKTCFSSTSKCLTPTLGVNTKICLIGLSTK